ncbi:stage V sporulation protein B [Clostridium rectalis]|uniref:stage V sporulation protein B n=1 Tax=Clostridium rectalis TaxID=2040295 RepID=UPI000F63238F|nr:stage V sporulation protein B [Clostridium rectalis]
MKKDTFFRDSFMLILSNSITGILGFIFSIILSHKLGAEGMGLYGLIMPIYNLFICLISGGMITAMSKVSAVYFQKRDIKNLNNAIHISIIFDIVWSIIIVTIVFLNASFFSTYIIKDSRSLNSLKVICPAMIFIAISSILKGYFYGISKVKIPAFIDIFEKSLRILIIISVTTYFSFNKISDTVTCAYMALTIGEFISTFLLYIFYRVYKNKFKDNIYSTEGRAQLLFNVLIVSLPLCLNGFLSTALSATSTLIVPRRLIACGIEYGAALSMLGKFTGMSLNIIFFPILVINSISTILIPDLSQTINSKDYWAMEQRVKQVLRISLLLGLSTTIICLTIPDNLGVLFYNRTDLSGYIAFASIACPIFYMSASTYGILNGLGKQGVLLRNSLIVSLEELILLYVLVGIPYINIYGYGISLILTSITTLILNIHEINKYCYISINKNNFTIVILNTILIYLVLNICKNLIPENIFKLKTLLILLIGFSLIFISNSIIKKSEQ